MIWLLMPRMFRRFGLLSWLSDTGVDFLLSKGHGSRSMRVD
jgi:hypothetical protein